MCHSCRNKLKKRPAGKGKTAAASMELLIRAAAIENPRQFQLPRNMSQPCYFPGTDKIARVRVGRKSAAAASCGPNATGGIRSAPPTSKCYVCRRTCRVGPLISCDYCPLYFHMDCLDPPLASPPADRWMCPNHVQHILVMIFRKF